MVHLAEMTWPEVAELARRTPVTLALTGATEAHGSHLPLGTNVITAQGSCRRVAELLAAEGMAYVCVVCPIPRQVSHLP
jgi:creatinine amidohydrolase